MNDWGKLPSFIDIFISDVIGVIRTSRHVFKRGVGMGSSSQDFDEAAMMSRLTSSSVTGAKVVSEGALGPPWGRRSSESATSEKDVRMRAILSRKKEPNVVASWPSDRQSGSDMGGRLCKI